MAASLDEGTVVRGDFAIAGSDAPALLDPVEEALDQIARPVQIWAKTDWLNYGDSAFNSPPRSTSAFDSRLRSGRLRPAFARLEETFGQSLEPVQKAIVSERPADALRGAQPGEQIGFGLAGQGVGETGKNGPGSAPAR
jgi:hypothetical protein